MHRRSQSEEETERNGGLSLSCSVRQARAGGFTNRLFLCHGAALNGDNRLEESSSIFDGELLIKTPVAGIDLIELRP